MIDFCILGSGISGSTIANLLSKKYSVKVFDKARGPGGRSSNKRFKDNLSFDHGVQYISPKSKKFTKFIQKLHKKKILKTLKNTKTKINNETKTAEQLCKRNDFSENQIKSLINEPNPLFKEVYYDVRYSGYVEKQNREISKMRNLEEFQLGLIFDYKEVVGLSGELQEKLNTQKPNNLYEASLVEGITPAALNVISIHLKKLDAIRAT